MARIVNKRRLNIRLGRIKDETVAEVRRALKRGGLAIENTAVEKIINPPKTGRIYPSRGRKGQKHQASAPGQPPAADTGELHGSITTVENSTAEVLRVETAANAPYAIPLEEGTSDSRMEPRPFMAPSFDENVGSVRENVRNAIRRGSRKGSR